MGMHKPKRVHRGMLRTALCRALCCAVFSLALCGLAVHADDGATSEHGPPNNICEDPECKLCYPDVVNPGGEDPAQNQDTLDAALTANSSAAPQNPLGDLAAAAPPAATPDTQAATPGPAQAAAGAASPLPSQLMDSARVFMAQRVAGVTVGSILLVAAVVIAILIILSIILSILRRAAKK